jgi:hypothetical protein
MIVRIWCAKANADGFAKYLQHFEHTVLPELQGIAGFEGADLLFREHSGMVEVEVRTMWHSFEAIIAFAKPDPDLAVIHPEAKPALLSFDQTVKHFEVLHFAARKT